MSLTGWKLARTAEPRQPRNVGAMGRVVRYRRVNDNNNNNGTVLQSFGKDRAFALIPK